MTTTMKFGKYKGRPITEVDLKYLLWCRDNLSHCPTPILDELMRRGQTTLTPRQAAKRARVEHKARKQRAKAAEKLDRFAHGVSIPNPDFERLREEYVKAGGDLTACPFDTDDYTYTGPGFVGLKPPSLDPLPNREPGGTGGPSAPAAGLRSGTGPART
jgi:hypothetical protein